MSRLKEKYTPVLNGHLIEGAFAECMSQVLMSLDQCRLYRETDMTINQHVRALWGITMDETGIPMMLTENRSEGSLRTKHVYYRDRLETLRENLKRLDPNEEANLSDILKEITSWLQDSHLILHEDTGNDVREYLSTKNKYVEFEDAEAS